MSEEKEYISEMQEELDNIKESSLLSPEVVRKKLIMWFIRNALSVVLIWYFWEHWFMKYALWVIIPLSLFSLFSILGFNWLVKKKLENTQSKVDKLSDDSDK